MTDTAEPLLSAKVAHLRKPTTYPGHPTHVELVETHMSWVFLTEREAYKLKKPVRRPYLDFTTIEARHRDCEAEVRLNKRLAPDVYLEAVPLGLSPDGGLVLFHGGPIVDWLVRMRRLPSEFMLDSLIRRRALDRRQLAGLAQRLVAFHKSCSRIEITASSYVERLERNIDENRRQLLQLSRYAPMDAADKVAGTLLSFLASRIDLLQERSECVVEGHGDLRPEHVCLLEAPVVIDCLEFSPLLRQIDTADEIAFLALECAFLGDRAVAAAVLDMHARLSGDTPSGPVLNFYRSARALLRAQLSLQHVADADVRNPKKWVGKTRKYMALAEQFSRALAD